VTDQKFYGRKKICEGGKSSKTSSTLETTKAVLSMFAEAGNRLRPVQKKGKRNLTKQEEESKRVGQVVTLTNSSCTSTDRWNP